jgi:transposase
VVALESASGFEDRASGNGTTLQQILNPATFAGIVISDNAAVYANFTASQKCWAHLLRKAIKLMLHDPNNPEYREFADRLVEIYRASRRVQRDGRLGDAGRARKIADLDDEILELCGPLWAAELPPCEGPDNDYRLLTNEVMRLMLAQELFTFLTAKPVEQPNGQTQTVGARTTKPNERFVRRHSPARRAAPARRFMVPVDKRS